MCGISGVVLRESESVAPAELERMAAAMIHRGPDGGGVFSRGPVGLAHRRLRVIDLSPAGDQPLFNEDGKVGIVFNGEIYNFRELREELEERGHSFRSRSDTEVIVHAFEEWGAESFSRLDGMFAFAIWDGRGRAPVVHLVRDRFGIKPLFYAAQGGRLAFASELKPLLGLPWVDRSISPETLFHFLKFSHVPGELSIVDGVRQLRPGSWLRFEGGHVRSESYWSPGVLSTPGAEERSAITEADALEELDDLLVRVVRRQIVSDVPLGCFLSGGVDSSLLAYAYSGLGEGRLKTFTIGYQEAEFDESKHALKVAEDCGTDHHERIVTAPEMIDLIPDVPTYFDQPFADPSLLPTLLLARFAREKVTVALSGDGGDELFFGYAQQRALLYLEKLAHLPLSARRASMEALEAVLRPILPRGAKLAEILQFRDQAELLQYFIGTIGPMRLDRLAGLLASPLPETEPRFAEMMESLEGLPWQEVVIQAFVRTFLVDTVLAKTDRASMAFGLEARVPFLDNEMAEFAARLPFRLKYRNGTSKYLLRRLLERKIPGEIPRRPKQGFSVPLQDWLRGDLRYLLDEYLNAPRLRREGCFHPDRVRDLVRAHVGGGANHSHVLWSLVIFQMWKERYFP